MTLNPLFGKVKPQTRYHLALLLVCLLGFGLRLQLLEDVYFHDDEEVSRKLYVQQPLSRSLTDYDPNNHWLTSILGHLMGRLGQGAFLLRWPSVLFGTLAISLIYRTGIRLFIGEENGLVAALLLGLSAFHLQWSQQFRGYSALLFFSLLAFLLLHRALRAGRPGQWWAFSGAVALAVASHLYGVLILLVSVVILVTGSGLTLGAERNRQLQPRWRLIISGGALVMIGYFIRFGQRRIINHYHPPPEGSLRDLIGYQWLALGPTLPQVDDFLKETAVAFTGHTDDEFALLLFFGLSIVGLTLAWRRFPAAVYSLALWLIVPVGVIIAAEFVMAGFFVFPRYLIFALPAWLLLTTHVLTGGSRRLAACAAPSGAYQRPIFLLLIIIGLGYFGRLNLNVARAYFAERAGHDWRAVANYLADHAAPTDLIVCKQLPHRWPPRRLDLGDPCTKELTRRLELRAASPQWPIRQIEIVAAPGTGLRFKEQAEQPGAVWVVMWGQAGQVSEQRLSTVPPVSYRASGLATPLGGRSTVRTFNRLGPTAMLKVDSGSSMIDNLERALSQLAQLDTASPDRFDYYIRQAYVLAYQDRALEAQTAFQSAAALPGSRPEALAEAGQVLDLLARFNESPSVPAFRLQAEFGHRPSLRLTGYTLPAVIQAGQTFNISLFWQGLAPLEDDYTVFVHLRNSTGQTVDQLDFRPFDGLYPTFQWVPGSTVVETRLWALPADLPPGQYRPYLGLYRTEDLTRMAVSGDASGENAVVLGQITIESE